MSVVTGAEFWNFAMILVGLILMRVGGKFSLNRWMLGRVRSSSATTEERDLSLCADQTRAILKVSSEIETVRLRMEFSLQTLLLLMCG
jgi:hypothetical protein